MKCVLLFIVSVSFTHGLVLDAGMRNVTKTLQITNGGRYGYWTEPEFCPPGTLASGYSTKSELDQFTGDDTALNSIRLTCTDNSGHTQMGYTITSGQSPFGNAWTKLESCNQVFHSSNFLVGFSLQVEGPQGNGDDTSANDVKFRCRDLAGHTAATDLAAPAHGIWGKYGGWSETCDDKSAICGLTTKIEPVQNDNDDTALNDVIFYCCNDIAVFGVVVGK